MLVGGDDVDVDTRERRYMGLMIVSERPTRRRRTNAATRNENAMIEMILYLCNGLTMAYSDSSIVEESKAKNAKVPGPPSLTAVIYGNVQPRR